MSQLTSVERVRRILSILPWIVHHPGCRVEDVCERFTIDRDSLIEDLEFVFYNVGVHPFTPDVLAEVDIEDNRIHVRLGDYFSRPLRLTPAEALTLLVAAKAMLRIEDDAETRALLSSAAVKLVASLGLGGSDVLDVNISTADTRLISMLKDAATAHESVHLTYYSYGRDELSERVVDPIAVTTVRGYWYLSGWCHEADDHRFFRIDRIYEAKPTGRPFDRAMSVTDSPADLSDRALTVQITGPQTIEWISRSYSHDSLQALPGDRLRVILPVTTGHWLERLILRLPDDAEVIDLDSGEDLRPIGAGAATRILQRYRHG